MNIRDNEPMLHLLQRADDRVELNHDWSRWREIVALATAWHVSTEVAMQRIVNSALSNPEVL